MSKPKPGRQHSPGPGRPYAGSDAGCQPAGQLARVEDAEARLKQLISEAHGLTGDLRNEMRRYKEARATLENLMTDIIEHRDKLQDAVNGSFRSIVEHESERIHSATREAINKQFAEIEKLTISVKEAIRDHEAELLGCKDAAQLLDLIAGQVFTLIKEDVENVTGKEILAGRPVDCPENRLFVITLGLDPAKMPWDKPEGAVQDACMTHQGPVWLGLELQKKRDRITTAGGQPVVVCLVCAARIQKGWTARVEN